MHAHDRGARRTALVEQVVEAYNAQDFPRYEAFFAEDIRFCYHNHSVELEGRKQLVEMLRKAAADVMPDRRLGAPTRITQAGDVVVREQPFVGTATGDLPGLAANGASIAVDICSVYGCLWQSSSRGAAEHHGSVRSAIEWSHRLLTADEQLVHRRLSVLPGPFTLPVATAVVGPDLDVADVPTVLARPGHPSTFHQLETVRAHARGALQERGEVDDTVGRRDDWVRRLLRARPRSGARRRPRGTTSSTTPTRRCGPPWSTG